MDCYLLEKWIGLLESSLTEEEQGFAENKKGSCVICSLHESVICTLLQGNVSRRIVLQTCVEGSQLESKPTVPVVLGGAQLHRTVQHLGRSIWVIRLAVCLRQQAGCLKLDLVDARQRLGHIPGLLQMLPRLVSCLHFGQDHPKLKMSSCYHRGQRSKLKNCLKIKLLLLIDVVLLHLCIFFT